jgi:Icc-related predicted phosphoesterase
MKFIALSDFHGVLPSKDLPWCDVLLIAGDISPFRFQGNKECMQDWIENEFKEWVFWQSCGKIVLIPGNHDFYLENLKTNRSRKAFEDIFDDKLALLVNEYYEIGSERDNSILIFGTPYCSIFGNWPFMRSEEVLQEKFEKLDSKVDILLTHTPGFNIGTTDCILKPKYSWQNSIDNVGSKALTSRLIQLYDKEIQPDWYICGHIHTGNHNISRHWGMDCANVSLMDEYCNKLVYEPLIFEI